ncbi:hypothetical protein [Streptomyces avicenniae]|uniref:hypothetical protein n=1 Tax=Streptomyces avicenniae TaxID=500153 RepID=UPI000699E671|nr:hypothetical protein [Streptomyces avicenniae]
MPNVSLTYADIEAAVTTMKTSLETIIRPRIQEAKADADDILLNSLIFPESSPVMIDKYADFTAKLDEAAGGIEGFAEQFRAIKEGMEGMDHDIAQKIQSNGE